MVSGQKSVVSEEQGAGTVNDAPQGRAPLRLSELTPPAGLFRSRLTGASVKYGAATIKLQALTTRQLTYILAHGQAEASPLAQAMLSVAWALESVSGLTDETGAEIQPERETVRVLGVEFHPVTLAWLDQLNSSLVFDLAVIVRRITNLSDSEQLRVDFT